MSANALSHPCKLCGHVAYVKYTIKNIPYYYCPSCNFLFNTRWDGLSVPTPEQIAANDKRREERWPAGKSDQMYEKGWEILEYMGWPVAWTSRQAHAALKKIPPYASWMRASLKKKFPRLLDFGCGDGITVTELRNRDHFNAVGLDLFSPTDAPYVIRESLIQHHFEDNTFDGIFSIETLEHIPNVLEMFDELRRILKPGGVLFIQTRRLEDPDYRAKNDRWFYLEDPTTHVSIYSEPAIRLIAKKTGWGNVSFRGVRFARFIK